MEIKIIFEIEEGSKAIIRDFSKALLKLGNTATIQSAAGSIIGKIETFGQPVPAEDLYVEQEGQKVQEIPDLVPQDKEVTDEATKEKPKKATKKKTEPTVPTEEKEEPTEEKSKKSEPVPTTKPTYTRADLARVGRELALNGKREEVLKAFTKLHAVSLADVKPEQFEELAEIYIGLGGMF